MILFAITVFGLSIILLGGMISLKYQELVKETRSPLLGSISHNIDPIVGRIITLSNFLSGEVLGDIFRFLAAKFGLFTARMLIILRNFSSKLAAHLYHTSRKVESGDPIASHPSFFIKAILDFKEKMKEENKNLKEKDI
jgi:hypothetical protein